MPNLLILGAGGFGRMIYENVQSTRQFDKIAMLDDAAKGPEVIGKLVDYTTLREEYPCAVAAFGNNKLRVQWVDRLLQAGFVVPTIIHPSAVVSPSAVVGAGSFVMQRAVVNTHTVLGKGCLVNCGAIIDHDTVVGDGAHISLGSVVKANCQIEPCRKVEAGEVIFAQRRAIDELLAGHDVMVLAATGGGKSLCYQVPALLRDGLTVVISPLVALMQDQVRALQARGVRAACLHAQTSLDEMWEIRGQIDADELDLLYLTPERVLRTGLPPRTSLIAVDEAHCVSLWGHQFRPDYGKLGELRSRRPDVPLIALTATASCEAQDDMVRVLHLRGPVIRTTFYRPNLRYDIQDRADEEEALFSFLASRHRGDSGVVYCQTRRQCEEITAFLRERGLPAYRYHSQVDMFERERSASAFLHGEGVIMVATNAFGMGIDKPDIRFVVHIGMPTSVEAYFQETGRAGRDGNPADALLIVNAAKRRMLHSILETEETALEAGPAERAERERRAKAMTGLCETGNCLVETQLRLFGEKRPPCGQCVNCRHPEETKDVTEDALRFWVCVKEENEKTGRAYPRDYYIALLRERNPDRSALHWQHIVRLLILEGLLWMRDAGLSECESVLEVRENDSYRDVLAGKRRIRSRRIEPTGKRALSRPLSEEERRRAQALRKWREDASRREGRAPERILTDAEILRLAKRPPRSVEALCEALHGAAERAENWTDEVLAVLRDHSSGFF